MHKEDERDDTPRDPLRPGGETDDELDERVNSGIYPTNELVDDDSDD